MGEQLKNLDPNAPGLLTVERARAWLAQAVAVDDVKSLRDKAEALAAYHRKQKAGKASALDADTVVVWAERRMGELSRELEKAPTRVKAGLLPKAGSNRESKLATLSSQGVKQQAASRYEHTCPCGCLFPRYRSDVAAFIHALRIRGAISRGALMDWSNERYVN